MMYKKYLRYIGLSIIIVFCINLKFSYSIRAKINNNSKVCILYDIENVYGEEAGLLKSIEEILGAFSRKPVKKKISNYNLNDINNFEYVFVIGMEGKLNNKDFFKDLKEYKGKIFWIGEGIGEYLKYSNKYNFECDGYKNDMVKLYYSNNREDKLTIEHMKKFNIEGYEDFPKIKINSDKVNVYGYLGDGKSYFPYVLNEKNLWYISKIDNYSILFYVFSDILNDIFNIKTFTKNKTLVRIEDVHPFRDVHQLKEITDYLYEENIPFTIALIPVYIDIKTGYKNTMSKKKDFIKIIKYMQEHGGSVILHGYTHQNHTGISSGEGYEFWDAYKDKPLNVNMKEYVYERVSQGIAECVKNGIYPLGFEAPHYAIDERGYLELKKYFSTYIGQFQNNNNKFTTTAFPYQLNNTQSFHKLIPENLGYVDPKDILAVEKIKSKFNKVSVVRGNTTCFFFHPFVDIRYLKQLISFFKEKDVIFMNLKKENNWVKCGKIKISSSKEGIEVTGYKKKKDNEKIDYGSKKIISYVISVNKAFIMILSIFILIFIMIFVSSKKLDKKRFFKDD